MPWLALIAQRAAEAADSGTPWYMYLIVPVAILIVIGQAMNKNDAHKKGKRSVYDEKCQYCGKRLKFQKGGTIHGQRMPVCHHCGREQDLAS
jgi:hypothetical protein